MNGRPNECNWCNSPVDKKEEKWHVSELGSLGVFHSACWEERVAAQLVDERARPLPRRD